MSLASRMREQEERGEELKARLDELAAEFAAEMRERGIEPVPLLERTGEVRSIPYPAGGGGDDYFGYRITDMRAWSVQAPLAVTTSEHLLFTEKGPIHLARCGDGFLTGAYVVGVTNPKFKKPVAAGQGLEFVNGDISSDWATDRERMQHNKLVAMIEKAYFDGLDAVVESIQKQMIQHLNRLSTK